MKKLVSLLLTLAMSMLVAAPAFASNGEVENSPRPELREMHKENRMEKKEKLEAMQNLDATQLACVAKAVDARETAVGTAFDALNTSLKSALSTRKTSLAAAWVLTDGTARSTAIKAAWKAFKDTSRAAHKTAKLAKKDAWKGFKAAVSACNVNGMPSESEGSDVI